MPNSIGILGRKLGMTRVYDENGRSAPVTVIEAGPCRILQIKTKAKEGYNALQLGFLEKKSQRLNKPEAGHFKRSGGKGYYHIKEFKVNDPDAYEVGQTVQLADIFSVGDLVDVSGKSKGRGFQGVVKRYGYRGGRKTHGSTFHRAPGSIGCSATPGRVVKGKKLPGRMGNELVTKKNVKVIDIRVEENVLLLHGAVPGGKQGVLNICPKP
ncbi:50S ribosomal protein L3 [Desulfobulbus oligotrophicus]|jgi:large subunit ribosomal protein L3|uniref:Large ribosomal subunit protein uL3 n=1 Tax=Desulfobulbus oligotrophicus TaxID=1909699 RepID=A0A7T5VDE5_9BACT|nr:50S ribosomal protein L3 [Desulfobulbus oligotrophicus]MDY0390362.1 50S ribosomal protein L3 [Desulfobulbus oligotrophicus]QQG65724.1 50S ribosomal protein L3 [Desulfobulbus oligotrophicus]